MIKQSVYLFLALVFFSALFSACLKKVAKNAAPVVDLPPGACDTITYSKHIESIISQNCTLPGCHAPAGSQVGLGDYQSVKNFLDNGKLKKRVINGDGGFMPPSASGLPQNQKDLIQCWIDNGGKEQ